MSTAPIGSIEPVSAAAPVIARGTVRGVHLGDQAPFRGVPERALELSASIEGCLPDWLAGDLTRTCPAVFEARAWRAQHWFDALGMLYQFRVRAGTISYRQRLMDTRARRGVESGRPQLTTFGTPSGRSWLSRLLAPLPLATDNVNVNVVALGGERVALTESPHQWAIDPDTLALTHELRYTDSLGELSMLAHPHFDFERQRIVNLAARFGQKTQILLFEHAPDARQRVVVGQIDVKRLPYLHAFGLTPRHAIIIGHPFEASALSLLGSRRGFIDHFAWRPEQGTTLWLIDRHSGAVRRHTAPAGFVFHVVNAFEDGDRTHLDVCLYDDPSIIDRLRAGSLEQHGFPAIAPAVVRYSMRAGVEVATVEPLLEPGFEFPSVNYRRHNGQRHRVAFGARVRASGSALVRFDLERGEQTFERPGFIFGEPVLVSRPYATAEDDGVLLAVGSHVSDARSALVVLDAQSLVPRAWAEVPVPVPLGFHGSFFRA